LIRRFVAGGININRPKLSSSYHAIITGANTGIGLETAVELATLGATVILACRNSKKTANAVKTVIARSGNPNVEAMELELDDFSSIKAFVKAYKERNLPLNLLVNNAAVMWLPEKVFTKDGFEQQIGVNHFGHAYLTLLLLPLLKASAPARIIFLSSNTHALGHLHLDSNLDPPQYQRFLAYPNSKLANLVFSNALSRRLSGTGVTSNTVHPGVVRTEITRHIPGGEFAQWFLWLSSPLSWIVMKSPNEGAQTTLHVALCKECESVGGKYWVDCKIKRSSNKEAMDVEVEQKLWSLTLEQLKWNENDI